MGAPHATIYTLTKTNTSFAYFPLNQTVLLINNTAKLQMPRRLFSNFLMQLINWGNGSIELLRMCDRDGKRVATEWYSFFNGCRSFYSSSIPRPRIMRILLTHLAGRHLPANSWWRGCRPGREALPLRADACRCHSDSCSCIGLLCVRGCSATRAGAHLPLALPALHLFRSYWRYCHRPCLRLPYHRPWE